MNKMIVNMLLLVGTTFLLLMVIEVLLNIYEPQAKYERTDVFEFYETDEILGWKNKPNSNGLLYIPDTVTDISINSEGYRDNEYKFDKKIIQIYGDSMTWGYGVNITDRFSNKLDNSLKDYKVMNMGVAGYGTDQEYLSYIHHGYKYKPDIVMVVYNQDLVDVSSNRAHKHEKPYFIIENDELKLSDVEEEVEKKELKKLNSMYKNSKLYRLIFNTMMDVKEIRIKAYEYSGKDLWYERNFKVLDKILIEFKNEVEKNGGRFVIVLLPLNNQVYTRGHEIERNHIIQFAGGNDIDVIDLFWPIRIIGANEKDLFFKIDKHYSEIGNEVIFQEIYNTKFWEKK